MTAPVRVGEDPLEALIALKKHKEQQPASSDPLDELMASKKATGMTDLLKEQGIIEPQNVIHRKYQTGQLQRETAAKNAAEQAEFADMPSGYPEAIARGIGGTLLNVGQVIPGMRALQGKVAQGVSHIPGMGGPRSYEQSLSDIDKLTGYIPPSTTFLTKALAAPATLPLLPSNPAAAGAILGYADKALGAEPDQSFLERTGKGLAGAAVGGTVGQVASLGRTAAKAKMAPEPNANIVARDIARSEAAGPEYDAFRKLGDIGPTQSLTDILDLPVVRHAVNTVKGESPILSRLPDTDARVLDAVYKRVGNKAFTSQFGYQTDEARRELRDAVEAAATAKGRSYARALDTFRQHSEGIGGVQRGKDVLANTLSKGGGSEKTALEKSPAALQRDFPMMSPTAQEGVREGLYGSVARRGMTAHVPLTHIPIPILPSRALLRGNSLANQLDPTSTEQVQRLLALINAQEANRE